jgi:hypothetical protein
MERQDLLRLRISRMSKIQNTDAEITTIRTLTKKIKSMTWDELNNWMLPITAATSAITFMVGLSTIYIGYRAKLEKDEKVRAHVERTGKVELELEKEKNAGRKLEKSLARREIPIITSIVSGVEVTSNLDPIKPFAGLNTIVEYLPDVEASRATRDLVNAIKIAGWNVVSVETNIELADTFWDGVNCEPYMEFIGRNPDRAGAIRESHRKSVDACNALADFLKSNNWEAKLRTGKPADLPPDTVRIRIGFKSFPRVPLEPEAEP